MRKVIFIPGFLSRKKGTNIFLKDTLGKANIKYIAKNEGVQDLFGVGRIGTGYNPIIGPTEIQVAKDDEQAAKDVLKDLKERGA